MSKNKVAVMDALGGRGTITQVEMDLLQGALEGKADMYAVLTELAGRFLDAGLDGHRMKNLYQLAQDQQARVRRVSDETMDPRFVTR